jgi:hypothetical protein
MINPTHYVCSECAFTSQLPGTCQNESCIRQGTKLTECHCQDGRHRMVIESHNEAGDDPKEQEREAEQNEYSTRTIDLDEQDSTS